METLHTKKKRIPDEWFYEIAQGLTYLHYNEIIHRDLNPKNILLDFHGRIKIADFGLATTTELVFKQKEKTAAIISSSKESGSRTGCVGTSYYVAPELMDEAASKSIYGTKSDIYSLGMIYFEMKHPPFCTGHERDKVMNEARSNKFPDFMQNSNITELTHVCIMFNGNFNKILLIRFFFIQIIKEMLDHDPKNRPVAKKVQSDLVRIFMLSRLRDLF